MTEEPECDDEATAKLKAMGIQFHDGIPIFPFAPDSVTESRFFVIEAGDLPSDEHVQDLIQRMWLEPEAAYYYYHGHNGGPSSDSALIRAKNGGDILMDVRERRHYKHPRFQRDYVQITPKGEDEYNWDWERDVVEGIGDSIRGLSPCGAGRRMSLGFNSVDFRECGAFRLVEWQCSTREPVTGAVRAVAGRVRGVMSWTLSAVEGRSPRRCGPSTELLAVLG